MFVCVCLSCIVEAGHRDTDTRDSKTVIFF